MHNEQSKITKDQVTCTKSACKKPTKNAKSPFGSAIEIISGNIIERLNKNDIDKLYWVSDAKPPTNISSAFFFNIDNVSDLID